MKALWLTPALAAMFLPCAAGAHPGHGSDAAPWGAWHYLTEPEHLLVGALAILLFAGIRRFRHGDRLRRVPVRRH